VGSWGEHCHLKCGCGRKFEGGERRRGDEVGVVDEELPWSGARFYDCCDWPQGMCYEWVSEDWQGVACCVSSFML